MNKEIIRIEDGIWQIRYYLFGVADVYMYLITGEEKALLIDTGYSSTDVLQYVRQVSDLPLIVVNSHGHMDHIGGNHCFDEVYISDKDRKLAQRQSDKENLEKIMEHILEVRQPLKQILKEEKYQREFEQCISGQNATYLDLPEDRRFHLGNRDVFFFETPGHTKGSICLFDETTGSLFCADTVCDKGVLLGFDESTGVREYRESLYRIREFCKENEVRNIYPSHHASPIPADLIDAYIDLCNKIINGEVQGIYKDTGTCSGLLAFDGKISLIYKEL